MTLRPALRPALCCLLLSVAAIAGAQESQAPPIDFNQFKPYTKDADEGDYLLNPPYSNAPELTPRADVPKGKVIQFTMQST